LEARYRLDRDDETGGLHRFSRSRVVFKSAQTPPQRSDIVLVKEAFVCRAFLKRGTS